MISNLKPLRSVKDEGSILLFLRVSSDLKNRLRFFAIWSLFVNLSSDFFFSVFHL